MQQDDSSRIFNSSHLLVDDESDFLDHIASFALDLEEEKDDDDATFNPYAVLGVKESASDKEIRAAWQRLIGWHPGTSLSLTHTHVCTHHIAGHQIRSDDFDLETTRILPERRFWERVERCGREFRMRTIF